MTDPYRNTTPPPREPYQDFHRDPDAGTGTSFLLGALILVALGGFIYYYSGSQTPNVASKDMRSPVTQPSTTGSGTPAEPSGTNTTPNNSANPQPARPAQ